MARLSVLIVEDEALLAMDLQDRLADLGYEIVGTAECADEAVALARDRHPHVVLTDIRLAGGSSGIDAARRIRADFDIPSIFLSGSMEMLSRLDLAFVRPLGCLAKPCDARALQALLARVAPSLTAARH